MISIILVILFFVFLLSLAPKQPLDTRALPVSKSDCPPHKWNWEKVYNPDGTESHERIRCSKCNSGPIGSE